MKKYNIVFLFILLLFLGLSKNVNISTKDNSSTTSNVASDVSTDNEANIPYIDNKLITFTDNSDGTATITGINASSLSGVVYIPPTVSLSNGNILKVIKLIGKSNASSQIYTSVFGSNDSSPNTKITGIVFPNTLTTLGDQALRALNGLTTLVLPSTLTNILDGSVPACANLNTIYVLGDILSIRNNAFWGQSSLKNIYFLSKKPITSWGVGTFAYAPSVTMYFANKECYDAALKLKPSDTNGGTGTDSKVTLSNNYDVQYSEEYSVIYNKSTKTIIGNDIQKVSDITVPSSIDGNKIENIGERAYQSNYFISSVDIEEGIININSTNLTDITTGAFYGDKNLSSIKLPSTLKVIGAAAFAECNINQINDDNKVPDSVTTLGNSAFSRYKGNSLILGKSLSNIQSNAFVWTNLKYIIFTSVITVLGDSIFSGSTASTQALFTSFDLYKKNSTIFASKSIPLTYKVSVQYQNVGLFNNPSFKESTIFKTYLDNHLDKDSTSPVNTYIYYAGDTLDMPTDQTDFSVENVDTLKMYTTYTNGVYSNEVTKASNASNILTKGTVGDTLVIYCNLYKTPTETSLGDYTVSSFDSNNLPISNSDFTIADINLNTSDNKIINLRFTNDEATGITGLPVVGYTYKYEWYVKSSNSSTFALISNNNDKEPSTLTLRPESGADLNTIYRCTLTVSNTSGIVAVSSHDILLEYIAEDINITINNQSVSNINAISSVYGIDYTASINGVVLSEDEMNLYFEPNYGIVAKSTGDKTVISFIGTLQEPYASTYQVNTLQTGILTTKTNSTNLILISVTSGLFVVEVIVFMVVIFKQRSRG